MKTLIVVLTLAYLPLLVFGQTERNVQLDNGKILAEGDTIQLVHGSIGKQQFKYVYINQSGLTKNTILDSQFDGKILWIKDFRWKKNKAGDKIQIGILDGTPFRIECEMKQAIQSGEVKLLKD